MTHPPHRGTTGQGDPAPNAARTTEPRNRHGDVLFVLWPARFELDRCLREAPPALHGSLPHLRLRRYPTATDRAHLLSLVRAGRDPLAVQWIGGLVKAVLGGAVLGALVNAVLTGTFGMFGGLLEIAVPLGGLLGAFLGALTATMTGTEVARPEVRQLAEQVRPGDMLLQWSGPDRAALAAWATHWRGLGLAVVLAPKGRTHHPS